MNEAVVITPGERYRRKGARRAEYAWITGHAHGSVSYRYSGGLASLPEALFLRQWEHAPKRQGRA